MDAWAYLTRRANQRHSFIMAQSVKCHKKREPAHFEVALKNPTCTVGFACETRNHLKLLFQAVAYLRINGPASA